MRALLAFILICGHAQAGETSIAKAPFLEGMKAGLPDVFCAEKTYFRKCFPVSKDDCAKQMKAAADECLASVGKDVPAQLHQPADGQAWGEKIGSCVGTKFESANQASKVKSPDCEDSTKWK